MYRVLCTFLILSLLQAEKGYSQIKGYVVDFDTQNSLEFVSISSIHSKKSCFSDKRGFFELNGVSENDTILFFGLGYQKQKKSVLELTDTIKLKAEIIESISVSSNANKSTKLFGDLRKPFSSIFFRNTNFSIGLVKRKKSSNIPVSFIENPEKREGFIEKVLVKLSKESNNTFLIDPITHKKVKISYKLPEYIKLRVVCFSVGANGEPDKPLTKEQMVFEIKKYQSQWLDISKFNVPFPMEGVFVGVQILELGGDEDVSGVKIPLLFESKQRIVKDFIFTPRGWIKSPYYQMEEMPKEIIGADKIRSQTFGFAVQVSFF